MGNLRDAAMKVVRVVLLCSLGCMLAMASGCGRSASAFWGCTYMNLGGETFSNVVISFSRQRWELGDDFRGGGAEKYMGVIGRMPKAVDIGVTSKDGRRHHIYLVVPRRPTWYRHRTSRIYLITESRCRAIATWEYIDDDHYYVHHPSGFRPRMNWSCAVADEAKEPFSHVTVTVGGKSYLLGAVGPKVDAALSALGKMPKALDLSFTSRDGRRHKMHITVPQVPAAHHGLQSPELYLLIETGGKVAGSYVCPSQLEGLVWYYGIMNYTTEKFSNVTVRYKGIHNQPWRVRSLGPYSGRSAGDVDGSMPKAMDISFTSGDGKRHTVHVILPARPVNQGLPPPEINLIFEKGGKVVATETH